MERPKSSAADISREVRGWTIFMIGAIITTAAAYSVFKSISKGKAAITDMLCGTKKKEDDESETAS